MLFEKLDRVVVAVSDIKKARERFNGLLGVQYYGIHDDNEMGLQVCLPKNLGLELVAPISEDSWVGQFVRDHGEGVMIVVYKVSDIEKAEKHLTEKGLKVINRLQRGESREVIFSPEEAHGMCIVINEYPDVHPVGSEVAKYFEVLETHGID